MKGPRAFATFVNETHAWLEECNGHGSADVLARLGRGEDVDAGEYTFRTSTHVETAAPELDWLNKGVFISVAGRQTGGVIYETYLVA